jgi:hypothetical protein
MPNRSLQAKFERAVAQRIEAGQRESTKHAYHADKRALRELSAVAYLVPKVARKPIILELDREMVLYNPRQPQAKVTPLRAAYVDFAPELIKRH